MTCLLLTSFQIRPSYEQCTSFTHVFEQYIEYFVINHITNLTSRVTFLILLMKTDKCGRGEFESPSCWLPM